MTVAARAVLGVIAYLRAIGTAPAATPSLVPLLLSAEMEPPGLPAYGRIVLDVLRGDLASLDGYDAGSRRPSGKLSP